MNQARTLALRQQLGGGSTWRTRLVLVATLAAMLIGGWFRFREIPEGRRAALLGAIVGLSVLFVLWKRTTRKPDPRTTRVEISETDFTVIGDGSRIAMPWSAFSECLESPELFVLMDRSKRTLIVVPKWAFPDEGWQAWFREQATRAPDPSTPASSGPPVAAPASSPPATLLTLAVHPKFRDFLACTLASWRTWGICLFVGLMMLGGTVRAALHPPPNAVNSPLKVLLMFIVPFYLVFMMIVISISSIMSWKNHAKYAGPEEFAISEESVTFSGGNGSGTLPWTSFEHYKETPWNFILWRGSHWLMFPKRAFASWDDMNRCRELLEQHLTHSRWFLG